MTLNTCPTIIGVANTWTDFVKNLLFGRELQLREVKNLAQGHTIRQCQRHSDPGIWGQESALKHCVSLGLYVTPTWPHKNFLIHGGLS